MRPTTLECATRAANHRSLADAATLDNVRMVQTTAAMAWEKEGLLAGKREARADAGVLAALGDGAIAKAAGPECD